MASGYTIVLELKSPEQLMRPRLNWYMVWYSPTANGMVMPDMGNGSENEILLMIAENNVFHDLMTPVWYIYAVLPQFESVIVRMVDSL